MCEKAAETGRRCVTLGPIIHNNRVITDLEAKGVRAVADIYEIDPEDTVIIRSHGAAKSQLEALASLGVNIIDATCPDVKKIHDIVRDESKAGRLVIIIGQRLHPEIVAISSWCGRHEVFEDERELSAWLESGDNAFEPVSLISQSTNSGIVYNSCAEIIKKECTNQKIFDTICAATCKRQQEAADLSRIADVMIVVGGKNSANSLRLADICRENCPRVVFAESADDIEKASIGRSATVGVIAGASTPASIIKEVTHKMSEEVSLVETRVEPEPKASPPELEEVKEIEAAAQADEPALATDHIDSEAAEMPVVQETIVEADDEVLRKYIVMPEIPGDNEPDAEETEEEKSGEEHPIECALEPDAPPETDEEKPPEQEISAEEVATKPYEDAKPDIYKIAYSADESENAEEPGDEPDAVSPADASAASESFEEMLEKSIKTLHTGEKVTGVVTSITATEVSVDLGTKQSGYIPISEFTDDGNTNIDDVIKIGDTIESFVMRVNDVEGMVMLSKKRLDAIKNWDVIEAAKENKTIVDGLVTEENKGGVVVNVKGVRVFVPASQTGLPKSSPMTELIRKPVKLRITEVNQSRRRVVGSIRMVQADERREKTDRVWNDIEVGKHYNGVVKSMTSYGVFVDIGGVDGMIHISELSWTRIKQPSEIMSIGDEVSVYVLSFDRDNRKISLGYKKSEDNPWTRFTSKNAVGNVVRVKIVKMMPFGAFAEICPGVDGLIHISQITDHRIGLPSEVLSDGQQVDVKITEIDNDRKKVSLSIRALIEPSSQPLTDRQVAEAAAADKTPVIVYDTDAPPPPEPEAETAEAPEEVAEEPEIVAAEPEEAAMEPEIVTAAPEVEDAPETVEAPKEAEATEAVKAEAAADVVEEAEPEAAEPEDAEPVKEAKAAKEVKEATDNE